MHFAAPYAWQNYFSTLFIRISTVVASIRAWYRAWYRALRYACLGAAWLCVELLSCVGSCAGRWRYIELGCGGEFISYDLVLEAEIALVCSNVSLIYYG